MIVWRIAQWIGGVMVLSVMALAILMCAFAFIDALFEVKNDRRADETDK